MAGADEAGFAEDKGYQLNVVVKEARRTELPWASAYAVVCVDDDDNEVSGRAWPRRRLREEDDGEWSDAVVFGKDGEVFQFTVGDDHIKLGVGLWSKQGDEKVLVGTGRVELGVVVQGLLVDEWRPLEGDPALGDVRIAVAVGRKDPSFDRRGPSVELSGEACAERRRRRDWAQKVTWERSTHNKSKPRGAKTVFVLRRRGQGSSLRQAWGLDVVEAPHDAEAPHDDAATVLEDTWSGGLMEGDQIVAATDSAELARLVFFGRRRRDTYTTLEDARGRGHHVWLVVWRHIERDLDDDKRSLKRQQSTNRRPSFLARESGEESERDSLRELAWHGFSRHNRQEVYRGVAFAMEFLSTRRHSRRDCAEPPPPPPTRRWRTRRTVSTGDPPEPARKLAGTISSTVRKAMFAFASHPRGGDTDFCFEDDATARAQLESALAGQDGDAHLGEDLFKLREAWQHKRQLSFEDAMERSRKGMSNKRGSLLHAVSKWSARHLPHQSRSSPSGFAYNDSTPRWIIDSLVVATQAALERAPLPHALALNRHLLSPDFTEDPNEDAEHDDAHEHFYRTFQTPDDQRRAVVRPAREDAAEPPAPRKLTALMRQASSRTRKVLGGLAGRSKKSRPRDAQKSNSVEPPETAPPKADVVTSADRVSRAYLARNSALHDLDGGIHEPTARALATILLDKVGVDERTSFYVIAFFFEELAAEATIHDRADSRDVASLSAALFTEQLPGLASALKDAGFPPNPAMLECWLTLFPLALPEVTLLRWLDVLLFEGWEGLVNIALTWYREHAKDLAAVAQSFEGDSACASVVCAIRDLLAESADADAVLLAVKNTPNEMLHRHALSLDGEGGLDRTRHAQDHTAGELFDTVMLDVITHAELEQEHLHGTGDYDDDDDDDDPYERIDVDLLDTQSSVSTFYDLRHTLASDDEDDDELTQSDASVQSLPTPRSGTTSLSEHNQLPARSPHNSGFISRHRPVTPRTRLIQVDRQMSYQSGQSGDGIPDDQPPSPGDGIIDDQERSTGDGILDESFSRPSDSPDQVYNNSVDGVTAITGVTARSPDRSERKRDSEQLTGDVADSPKSKLLAW